MIAVAHHTSGTQPHTNTQIYELTLISTHRHVAARAAVYDFCPISIDVRSAAAAAAAALAAPTVVVLHRCALNASHICIQNTRINRLQIGFSRIQMQMHVRVKRERISARRRRRCQYGEVSRLMVHAICSTYRGAVSQKNPYFHYDILQCIEVRALENKERKKKKTTTKNGK